MKQRISRPALVWTLIAVHLVSMCGCGTTNRVTLGGTAMPAGTQLKIASVVLKDGAIVEFDGGGGLCVEKTSEGKPYHAIVGTAHRTSFEIEAEKVLEVRVEQKESSGAGNFIGGFLLGMPIGAGLFFLILALSFSGH